MVSPEKCPKNGGREKAGEQKVKVPPKKGKGDGSKKVNKGKGKGKGKNKGKGKKSMKDTKKLAKEKKKGTKAKGKGKDQKKRKSRNKAPFIRIWSYLPAFLLVCCNAFCDFLCQADVGMTKEAMLKKLHAVPPLRISRLVK